MKSYLCFVHVRPNAVPQLRALDCADDAEVPESLASVLGEWASLHSLEVMEGDRLVFSASGPSMESYRAPACRS